MPKFTVLLAAVLALAFSPLAVADSDSDIQVASAANTHYDVNGYEIRLANDDEYGMVNFKGKPTFRQLIIGLARRADLSVEEALDLNDWADIANETVPTAVKFWVHPTLNPRSRLVASN
jgi:hypothetical protein